MGKKAAEWLCCLILCFCIVMNVETAVRVQYPKISYVLGKGSGSQGIEDMADQFLSFRTPLFSYMKDMKKQEAVKSQDPAYDRIRAGMDGYAYGAEDYEEITEGHQTEAAYQQYAASGGAGEQSAAGEPQAAGEGTGDPAGFQDGQEEQAREAAGQNITYSMEQLSDFQFLVKNLYFVHPNTGVDPELLNASAMLSYDAHMSTPPDQPQILIYHTHASEYFSDSDANNPDTLITGVGERLAGLLRERYGFNVIHDTTLFPYQQAYSQGLNRLTQILEENPSIEVVIDLHRDAAEGNHYVTEVDGKQTAQIMFFNGVSRSTDGPIDYLENPYVSENLAFSFQLKMAADALYPGLTRRNYLRSYRYNLHMRPKSVLIEVGAETNSLEEELNAVELLAEILASVLKGDG